MSVVTPWEASADLSRRDLQRIMGASVPGPKCLSGRPDNAWRSRCVETHVQQFEIVTKNPLCAAREISDKTEHIPKLNKLSGFLCGLNIKYSSFLKIFLKHKWRCLIKDLNSVMEAESSHAHYCIF